MKTKKIVVIDDDQDFLTELNHLLTLSGYEVIYTSKSENASAIVQANKPDVILMDLQMKGKNGFQLIRELKSVRETAPIPIIVMTGTFTEKEHAFIVRSYGIEKILIKPVNPLDIIAGIEWVN